NVPGRRGPAALAAGGRARKEKQDGQSGDGGNAEEPPPQPPQAAPAAINRLRQFDGREADAPEREDETVGEKDHHAGRDRDDKRAGRRRLQRDPEAEGGGRETEPEEEIRKAPTKDETVGEDAGEDDGQRRH